MTERGIVQERLTQLMTIEEDQILVGFHQQVFQLAINPDHFIAWEMLEGETFPDIEPFKPLVTMFITLWYSIDMNKQWQSNDMFHKYYNQLKVTIHSEPRMTPNTLHRFRPLMKFSVDRHFICIIACADGHKQ
jgi:hypothetical protein